MHFYSISGLSVGSEIALPGLIPIAAPRRAPEVTIRTAPVPSALASPQATGPTWQIAAKQLLLHIPNVARFLLDDGRDIAVQAEAGSDAADIPVFILGTVFGILLHQRGEIVLHASAVRVHGKAVLFCGASGSGKSTIAAALGRRGFPLVTDDVCAVTINAQGLPLVHPDGRQLKLWQQAIEKLDLHDRRGERVRRRLDKYFVDPGEALSEPLPLGAVYALREARPPHAPGIERPNGVDAALILRRNAYRPQLVSRMQQREHYFRAATTIANLAGIFHLTRRLDFSAIPETLARLEQHWTDIGLSEKAA